MKQRGFEVVSHKANQGINLPQRQTKQAAGYDFEASEDFVLPSIWKHHFLTGLRLLLNKQTLTQKNLSTACSRT